MRLIDADKLVEDLTNAAELAENVYFDSENVVAIFTAFIGFVNSIPTASKAVPAKPLPLINSISMTNFEGRCPECNTIVNGVMNYCQGCGQRLLWNLNIVCNNKEND